MSTTAADHERETMHRVLNALRWAARRRAPVFIGNESFSAAEIHAMVLGLHTLLRDARKGQHGDLDRRLHEAIESILPPLCVDDIAQAVADVTRSPLPPEGKT